MSDPKSPEDELAGTEQPFVTHLIELRDRLVRAVLAGFRKPASILRVMGTRSQGSSVVTIAWVLSVKVASHAT